MSDPEKAQDNTTAPTRGHVIMVAGTTFTVVVVIGVFVLLLVV